MLPRWLGHMFLVKRTRTGVPIFVHWSVPALCLFILGTGVERIFTAAAVICSYLAILVIHEFGHQIIAQRLGIHVAAIKIYPIHGSCLIEAPESPGHDALIAWGGPAAQFIVAIPLAAFVILHGPTRMEPADAVLAMLGFFSPLIALINLFPIEPLDGRKAWMIVPLAWRRIRRKGRRPEMTAMEAMEEALRKVGKRTR